MAEPATHFHTRIQELQAEFQARIAELENQVDELQNLYITSTQLMSALAPDEVVSVLREILLNLIGAEGFDVSIREKGDSFSSIISGEIPSPTGGEALAQWIEYRRAAIEAGGPMILNLPGLVAVIPLTVGDNVLGVLSIFQLLPHKGAELSVRDMQLLQLLATHAATALVCATLFQRHTNMVADYLRDLSKA